MNKKSDVQSHKLLFSATGIGRLLLAAAILLIISPVAVRAGELTGSAIVNYRSQEENGETSSSTEERITLNWSTAFNNIDLLNLYFQFSRLEQNNPDTEELRPLVGLNLTGPEYHWLIEYREFEQDSDEPGGFTQTTDTLFTTFTFEPDPEYPDLTLDFSRVSAEDDLEEPQTDFVETNWGVRTTYEKEAFSIRAQHRERDFDNQLTTVTTTNLQLPVGVAVDLAGVIYVTESVTDRVFRFSPSGTFLGDFGGFGSGEGQFNDPRGIDVSSSFIYVVDSENDRVERFDTTGRFISEWGTFGSGNGQFNSPYGVAVDATGVYVTDQGNDRVQKFTAAGAFLFSFGTFGSGPGNFSSPSGIASNGALVFVADTQNHRIQVFTTDGAFVTEWGAFGSGPGEFQFPLDVAIGGSNRVYVTDSGNNRVQVFTTTGVFLDEFGSLGAGPAEFNAPQGIAITPGDDAVVADTGNARFQVLTNAGLFILEVGSVSGEERSRSTELVSDFVNVLFARQLYTGVFASVDYDFFRSVEEDKESGDDLVSTLSNEISAQLRLQPYRWITLSSIFDIESLDTETGDVETERDQLTQSYILSLQPIPRVNFSASYILDSIDNNIGPDEDSAFTTVSLNLLPTSRISMRLGYSNQQSEEDGEKTLETDTFSATTDMRIYRGVNLNVQLSTSETQDFESDGQIESQRIRGRLRLMPRPNIIVNTSAEYSTSDSTFADAPDISSETVLTSVDLTWAISQRLNLFLDADYIQTDSAGTSTDRLSYLSNLVWRMNDQLTFFTSYRGGTDSEKVFTFGTQAKFPFIWDTDVSINYEIEDGEETDRESIFVELTKAF